MVEFPASGCVSRESGTWCVGCVEVVAVMTGAAWHEAGHAVVAEALGFPVRYAAVDGGEGETGMFGVEDMPDDVALVVLLAGVEAARRGCGETPRKMFAQHPKGSDEAKALEITRSKARLDRARSRAQEVLGKRWATVASVAAELDRRGYVDGVELMDWWTPERRARRLDEIARPLGARALPLPDRELTFNDPQWAVF